jgi:predicted membrane protein
VFTDFLFNIGFAAAIFLIEILIIGVVMEERRSSNGARYTLGVVFIILGVFFLLDTMNIFYFDFGRILSFPLVLFVLGLIILLNTDRKLFGGILTVVGALLLIGKLIPGINIGWGVIMSLLVIGLGIHLILKHRKTTSMVTPEGEEFRMGRGRVLDKDMIDDVAIFGGGAKVINSNNFKGGSITAVFGGSEIDLTNCKLAEGENVIDVVTIFGGCEIFVPKDWNVILDITPIFGGFSNKVRRDPNMPVQTDRSLVIRGTAIFGGGEIKS